MIAWLMRQARDWRIITTPDRSAIIIDAGKIWGRKGGFSVFIHKFSSVDDKGCFHSHPSWAFRIILKGGYVEERKDGQLKTWYPGMMGLIAPDFEHRIDRLLDKVSYSLWIRGPIVAKINFACR